MEAIPHARIAPDFLQSNAQAHHDILYAVADLLDNTREAGAQRCEINVRHQFDGRSKHSLVEMVDDGCGMTEGTMRAMLSIAYTQKDRTTGKHYGMGSTTSIPRLCKSALCFSVHSSGHCTVGLLSTTLSKKIGASELKVPQCSWSFDCQGGDVAPLESFQVRDGKGKELPLGEAARRDSLSLMLKHTPFSTEEALLEEFRRLQRYGLSAGRAAGRPATGTAWLLWNVNDELILSDHHDAPNDIVVRSRDQKWPFEKTLRGFCEVLYYCDDAELRRSKPMVIAIKDVDVEPRNWSQYLKNSHTATPIKPPGAITATQRASVTFGYSEPLREVVRLFQDTSAGKNDFGSPCTSLTRSNHCPNTL